MQKSKFVKCAIYARVSTDRQELDAQIMQCVTYAHNKNIPVHITVSDQISGSTPWETRKLKALIDPENELTDLIVYEYSRIGRDMLDTLDFLKAANEAKVTVHIVKDGTIVDAGISGKIMSTVMTLAAEIERDLLRSRTKDALAERKRKIKEEGGFISAAGNHITKLGRPTGATSGSKLDGHKDELETLFNASVADTAIARIFDCDRRTVTAYRKAIHERKT